ncbi:MsnO8 family LLM class oxidoreductase [Tenacibaculum aestuarii]|uniref:MsnO8 family LLM class oxidoreductase n=1 Tax=Tenacibaculum aestuarii TaxID=362781 RepID=UPI00389344A0
MKLSVLDLSIVPKNGDRHQALMNSLELAQQADALGFSRFWVAEHHAAGTGAGRTPEVMIPFIAAQTKKIKVGSGAVLLNHYSPFKVAETFNSLEELFPKRIDMGIGRATGGQIVDMALQRHRSVYRQNINDSADQLIELLHWMNQGFDPENPFSEIKSHHNGTTPEFWLLGSGPWSSNAAAELGLRYAFAGFINPTMSYGIAQHYHQNFKPIAHESGSRKPQLMLALNVFAAETEEEAHRMTAPLQLFEYRLRTKADTQSLLEDEDTAIKLLGDRYKKPEELIDPKQPPKVLASTPEKLYGWLTQIAEVYGTDEIMLQTITGNHEARLKSQKLLAEVFFKKDK